MKKSIDGIKRTAQNNFNDEIYTEKSNKETLSIILFILTLLTLLTLFALLKV